MPFMSLLNLNVACDLKNTFSRQVILIKITDIASSVLNLPGIPVPTGTMFLNYISIIINDIMIAPEH